MTKEQAEYVKQLRCIGCTYRAIARHYDRKFPDADCGTDQMSGELLVIQAAQILDESNDAWDDAGKENVGYDVESTDVILRQFTREIMGPSVAHMSDRELDRWMEAWAQPVVSGDPLRGYPEWFLKRRKVERMKLLAVLRARR